jgi:hypothetical protein
MLQFQNRRNIFFLVSIHNSASLSSHFFRYELQGKIMCNNLNTLLLNTRKITLGISKKHFENRNTVNHIWLISKYIHLM